MTDYQKDQQANKRAEDRFVWFWGLVIGIPVMFASYAVTRSLMHSSEAVRGLLCWVTAGCNIWQ